MGLIRYCRNNLWLVRSAIKRHWLPACWARIMAIGESSGHAEGMMRAYEQEVPACRSWEWAGGSPTAQPSVHSAAQLRAQWVQPGPGPSEPSYSQITDPRNWDDKHLVHKPLSFRAVCSTVMAHVRVKECYAPRRAGLHRSNSRLLSWPASVEQPDSCAVLHLVPILAGLT